MGRKNNKSSFESVLNRFENLILTGVLRPRQRLVEAELCEMLDVSRYWIRDAFKILEGKGLVKIIPYKGAVVADLSEKEIEDIFVIRVHLERLAIHLGLPRIDASNIKELKKIARKFEACYENKDVEGLIKYNSRFHDYIFDLSDNPALIQMIVDLRTRLHITRYAAWSSPGILARIVAEHQLFIAALEQKDVKTLDELCEKHIGYAKDRYLSQLKTTKALIQAEV